MDKNSKERTYGRMYGHTFSMLRKEKYKKLEDVYEWASTDKDAKEIFDSSEDVAYFWYAARDAFNDYSDQVAKGVKPEYNKPITKLFRVRYGEIS